MDISNNSDGDGDGEREEQPRKRHKGKHDKPKPWDDETIDHWKVEPFDPESVKDAFLEASSFSIMFPKYREKYVQDCWPAVRRALSEYGISCELNLVKGTMTVSTTMKTRDPSMLFQARDLIKLLSRSVPAPQAIKILNDEMTHDIIKIGGLVRKKERFVKLRQRLVGPNSSTLKALEILTGCYILVQGATVAAMGSHKGLKQVEKIVVECMQNKTHPVNNIKTLMIKRELAKDPALANESWDRFLPIFKKKNVQQKKVKAKEKKPYDPLPPPQPPRKVDLELESGEYHLSNNKKSAKKWQEKQGKQAEKVAENKRKRDESFIPPEEPKKQRASALHSEQETDMNTMATSLKKKAKEFGYRKSAEKIHPDAFVAKYQENRNLCCDWKAVCAI